MIRLPAAFRRLTPREVVARTLANAELCLLASRAEQELADAQVGLLERRIDRLRAELHRLTQPENPT